MSYCLINSKNFSFNIQVIQKYIDINKIAIVLKNNAYGHGLLEMAKIANKNSIKNAVVINYEEANRIVNFFDSILVLSGIPDKCPPNNVYITINQLDDMLKIPSGSNVELKVDTGMNRNGIKINQIEKAIKIIKELDLNLKGVFTHFSNAFENDGSMESQEIIFDNIKLQIEKLMPNQDMRFHCSSSPGVFRLDNNKYDIARIGIALYGYVDLPNDINYPPLKPILSLWSEKISERIVQKGQYIGYGRAFKADKEMTISTYDIGYGNGFFRLDENKQFKISDGRDILGRVSMNNLAIEGNDQEVCIFNDVTELAKFHNTISYEILCRLDSDIIKKVI